SKHNSTFHVLLNNIFIYSYTLKGKSLKADKEVSMVQQCEPNGNSEVTRIMQQIEEEYTAARRGLHEYATVGRHEIITNRFNQAGQYIDRLAQLVGEKEAQHISTQI